MRLNWSQRDGLWGEGGVGAKLKNLPWEGYGYNFYGTIFCLRNKTLFVK